LISVEQKQHKSSTPDKALKRHDAMNLK